MVGCGGLSNVMDSEKLNSPVKQIAHQLKIFPMNVHDYVQFWLGMTRITYNADETGLFFRMEPNQRLSTGAIAGRQMVRKKLIFLFKKMFINIFLINL